MNLKEIDIDYKIQYHNEKFEIKKNLSLKNVYFDYDNKKNYILDNINIELKLNSSIGIFGQSGSGKTTLLDIISGLIVPSEGDLIVDHQIIKNDFLRRKIQNNISYISQKTTVINDTLMKNICFGVDEKNDINKYNQVIEICELRGLEEKFNLKNDQILDFGKNISGGQLQRIGIARALYENKEILIFDESTNALDETLEKSLILKILDQKKTKF